MRVFVVGDIHGGLRGLEQVLERTPYSTNDKFIFVGDYVDGWSENAETVAFLIEFEKQYNSIFLRGNHDELVHKYLANNDQNPMWLAHGGKSSLDSYAKLTQSDIDEHIAFFDRLENYYFDDSNRLFLHAGFTNPMGPAFEHYPNLVYWDRTLWEMVCSMDKDISEDHPAYPPRLKQFDEIYIGHTPVTRIGFTKPVNYANVWNVDTGAAFKGPLSIMDIDTKELWQSDPVWSLYPGERGRKLIYRSNLMPCASGNSVV